MFNIYGKAGCSSCIQAKQLLDTVQLNYQYLSFGKDYDMDKFMSFGVPHKSFPLITQVIDGEESYVGGLEQLKQLLK